MVGAHYLGVLLSVASIAVAQDPFYMCTDDKCESCPSAVSSTGTGYPDCVLSTTPKTCLPTKVTKVAKEGKFRMYPIKLVFANLFFPCAEVMPFTSTCRSMKRVVLQSSSPLLRQTL